MLPSLISQLVVILKETSLAGMILGQYQELLRASNLATQQLDNPLPMFLVTGAVYAAINWLLSKLAVYAVYAVYAEYAEHRGGRVGRSRRRRRTDGPLDKRQSISSEVGIRL